MATYSYVATDSNGRTVRGKETADNPAALTDALRQRKLFCTSYTEVKEQVQKQSVNFKFKTGDLAFFCRQLSSMLSAGISLVKALHILVDQQTKKKPKELLTSIYDDVQKGKNFSEALAVHSGAFPNLFLSMVAAGEASGNLDVIMSRVSDHYMKDQKTHNKIKGALTYPIILGILMVVIVIALMVFIMPMFIAMYEDPDDLPALTAALNNISQSMINYWYIYVIAVAALVIGIKVLMKVPAAKSAFDKAKIKAPKAGKLVCTVYTARFARTMSNLFASGLPMVECIEKSIQTLGNAYVSERFVEVVENVKHGESFSSSMAKVDIFESIFTSIVYVGEESGTLDHILETTADFYDEQSDAAISQLVALIEPIMIVVLAGMVCLILVAIYPALYGSFNSLG